MAAVKPDFLPSLRLFDAFDETERLFANLKKKSVIGFFGNSGSGKSTLVNTVIGEDVLPTGDSPTTRLVTLVGHSEYRPPSLSAKAALFKKGFSPHMIHNPDHVAGHLLEQGVAELLSRAGDAYFAVVFCTADICRHVWLMDAPGDLYDPGSADQNGAGGSFNQHYSGCLHRGFCCFAFLPPPVTRGLFAVISRGSVRPPKIACSRNYALPCS